MAVLGEKSINIQYVPNVVHSPCRVSLTGSISHFHPLLGLFYKHKGTCILEMHNRYKVGTFFTRLDSG